LLPRDRGRYHQSWFGNASIIGSGRRAFDRSCTKPSSVAVLEYQTNAPASGASEEVRMTTCPECESELELGGYDLDLNETIHCPECSIELKVVSLDPIKIVAAGDTD
jgi:lysine biosynthesis protein LysW